MSWLWWLCAPVAVTCGGAFVGALFARRSAGAYPNDPVAAHNALLAALGNAEIATANGRTSSEAAAPNSAGTAQITGL